MISVLIALSVLGTLALGPWLSQLSGGVEVELWERGRKALRKAITGEDADTRVDIENSRMERTNNVRVLPPKIQDGRIP